MRTLGIVALALIAVSAHAQSGALGSDPSDFYPVRSASSPIREDINSRLIANQSEWESAWTYLTGRPGAEAPSVDFSRWKAAIIVNGAKPTSGYELAVRRVTSVSGRTAVIDVTEMAPAPDAEVRREWETPFTVVKISRQFEDIEVHVDFGDGGSDGGTTSGFDSSVDMAYDDGPATIVENNYYYDRDDDGYEALALFGGGLLMGALLSDAIGTSTVTVTNYRPYWGAYYAGWGPYWGPYYTPWYYAGPVFCPPIYVYNRPHYSSYACDFRGWDDRGWRPVNASWHSTGNHWADNSWRSSDGRSSGGRPSGWQSAGWQSSVGRPDNRPGNRPGSGSWGGVSSVPQRGGGWGSGNSNSGRPTSTPQRGGGGSLPIYGSPGTPSRGGSQDAKPGDRTRPGPGSPATPNRGAGNRGGDDSRQSGYRPSGIFDRASGKSNPPSRGSGRSSGSSSGSSWGSGSRSNGNSGGSRDNRSGGGSGRSENRSRGRH